MRPSLSLRSILVIALLLAGGFAGASSCAGDSRTAPRFVPLDEAVRRTVAAGSARLSAEIRDDDGAVTITGVASLQEPRSAIVAEAPGSPPVEVRVTGRGTWLRPAPDEPWTLLEAGAAPLHGAPPEWVDLLHGLEPVGRPTSRTLQATHGGAPARLQLDDDGRIRRLRIDTRRGHLDLHLTNHGVAVVVDDP